MSAMYGPEPEPVAPESTDPPTVRETATVTVKKAVDGTRKRRKARASSTAHRPHRKVAPKTTHEIVVRPDIMEAAKEAKAKTNGSTVLVIVGPEEVWIVNKGNAEMMKRLQERSKR